MKPILHGLSELPNTTVVKICTGVVNVENFIAILEANKDKKVPQDWSQNYEQISKIYTHMFFQEHLPEDVIHNTDQEIFEMAMEGLGDELEDLIEQPKQITGRNYYYEYARSLAMDEQIPLLKEHIGEDCDFI